MPFSFSVLSSFYSVWPLSIPKPTYGWYRGDSKYWNSAANLLYDISGYGNHASTGSNIKLVVGNGDGAIVALQYLTGRPSSKVVWPKGSIPSSFTICSVTRYIAFGKMEKILAATNVNWYHGHWSYNRGVAFYDWWKTIIVSVGGLTDWLVLCGKNGGSVPTNILVDGIAVGTWAGGTGSSSLSINAHLYSPDENSNWAFRELMIWDTALSDMDMVVASTALRVSLLYGQV